MTRTWMILPLLMAACGEPKNEPQRPNPDIAALASPDETTRHDASIALGKSGGADAREALLSIMTAPSPDPQVDGPNRLYAAAGLTMMADPASAVRLIEALSRVNPNDNIAVIAREIGSDEYYTVDVQICEALLAMGLWTAEEELCNLLRRKDRVRVLIDAYAVLRRYSGATLPFFCNGSYAERLQQAEALRAELRQTRSERRAKRPFDASNADFQKDCRRVVAWLGGKAMNERFIAHKVLDVVGPYAIPFLREALATKNRASQRQALYMMGRIGSLEAAKDLRGALELKDPDARAEAIDALVKIGDADAPVGACLRDPDPEVRAAAARYVALHPAKGSVDALRASVAKETRPAVVAALWIALLRLDQSDALQPVLRVYVEGEQIERELAQAALEDSTGRKLTARATDSKEHRRRAAEKFRDR